MLKPWTKVKYPIPYFTSVLKTLNALVLLSLTVLMLIIKPERLEKAYGPDSEERNILASIYFAIRVGSIWAMCLTGVDAIEMALPILYLQIIYNLSTVLTVGFKKLVVISNLWETEMEA
jgi:hypothetical protein